MNTMATVEIRRRSSRLPPAALKGLSGFALAAFLLSAAASAAAHDAPDFDHSHAFQQSDSGVWRQGHSVNGAQGSIVIWSPRSYDGYQKTSPVRFARPRPLTRPPGGAAVERGIPPGSPAGPGTGTGTWPRPPR